MSKRALKRIRAAVGLPVCRQPVPAFSDIGGYPVYYLAADGEALCAPCVNAHTSEIAAAIAAGPQTVNDDWRLIASDVNYENAHLNCDHCGKGIPPAYLSAEEWEQARTSDAAESEGDGGNAQAFRAMGWTLDGGK